MKKAIKCGRLFDSNEGKVLENKAILIDGERITDVINLSEFNPEGFEEVIDLSGKFVMPGLIDCHMHIASNGLAGTLAERALSTIGDMTLRGLKNAQKHLNSGFTTIRNLGTGGFADVAVKNAINSGLFDGPRLLASGPSIGSTGGHADSHYNPYLIDAPHTDINAIVDSPDEARKTARYVVKYGADVIKFMATGGVMSMGTTIGAQQLTYDEMRAMCEVAEMYGVHTATHAHGTNGIKDAVRAGVTSVEHGMIMDEECVELMAKKGTYLSPTIIAPKRIIDNGTAMGIAQYVVDKAKLAFEKHEWGFRKCLESGVTIVFGTDCGTPFNLHGEQFDEFTYLTQFGMTNVQALTAATKSAAKLLRMWDDIGSITAGKYADITAYDGDPTVTIKDIEKGCFVMKGGKVYKG
ncbi:MAG: amidohydrolase family protein [Clostridiales bacterium]|nr:amidohydrolase family protein [Clostridiales bacterium]